MSEPMPRMRSVSPRARQIASIVVVLAVFVLLWEGYKLIWLSAGWIRPIRPDHTTMPHVWDMVIELFRPVRRSEGSPLLIVELAQRSIFTLREAVVGFLVGGIFGFSLAVIFVRSVLLERAFMPYVVASQTVPIIAIAPMVVVWGGRLNSPQWLSVAAIAAYLTFFPVAINTLRGLRSPDPNALELMRSYAAKPSEVLWKLQVPSALPYIFTALKISATASVIGALIGELPAGFGEGLGRALLTFSSQFGARSVKLYATVIVVAIVGILFVGSIVLLEKRVIKEGATASSDRELGVRPL
jgi:NitT/TauT family transport system permease protein